MEELENIIGTDTKEIIIYTAHNYMKELLGDALHILLSFLLVGLGVVLFTAAISNSNILLGDPSRRDKSQLSEVEYRKTRTMLRVVLGIVGFILFGYNLFGLFI